MAFDLGTIGPGAGSYGVAGDPTNLAAGAIGGAAELGLGAATGNPIAILGGIASLAGSALSFFGSSKEAGVQKEEAKVSADIAAQDMAINQQRQVLAQTIFKRQQDEAFRKQNIAYHTARATGVAAGLSAGVGQGSSGVAGGEAQTEAEGAVNQLSLSDNYIAGQRIFGLTSSIDMDKIRLAQLGGRAAQYAGISALGGSLAQAGPALTRLTGGFGLPNPGLGGIGG